MPVSQGSTSTASWDRSLIISTAHNSAGLELGGTFEAFGTREGQIPSKVVTFFNKTMDSKFGFSSFAEAWNGRLAMMGFIIGLGTELLTGQGILSQIGMG